MNSLPQTPAYPSREAGRPVWIYEYQVAADNKKSKHKQTQRQMGIPVYCVGLQIHTACNCRLV